MENKLAGINLHEENPTESELLLAAKEELGEMSKDQGEIVYLGTLKEVLGSDNFEGNVSLKKRLENGEITDDEVDEVVEQFKKSYVETTRGAAKRCVDGRGKKDYNAESIESYGEPLGPQVQGGTVDEAAAKRLDKGFEEGATLLSDVNDEAIQDDEFTPGSHDDEHGPEGCGAVKGQESKLAYYLDQKKFESIKAVTKVIEEKAGRLLPDTRLDHLPDNAKILIENQDSYYADKVAAVDAVKAVNPSGKATLIGEHNEVAVIVNFVKNTTLHTDQVAAITDRKFEAFGLDAWDIDNPVITSDAIATLMNLTDGSLRLYLRVPSEDLQTS